MVDDIPQEVYDQIAAEEAAMRGEHGGASGSGGSSNVKICPHCTFVNEHGGDCDVCGLPLS